MPYHSVECGLKIASKIIAERIESVLMKFINDDDDDDDELYSCVDVFS